MKLARVNEFVAIFQSTVKRKQMMIVSRSVGFSLALFASVLIWTRGFLHVYPSLRHFKPQSTFASHFFPQILQAAPKKNPLDFDEALRKEIEQDALNVVIDELTKYCVDLYELASKAPFTAKDLNQLNKDLKITTSEIQSMRKRPVLLQTYENLLLVVIETSILDPLQITTFEEIVNVIVDHIIKLFPKSSTYSVDLVDAFNDAHLNFIERFVKLRQENNDNTDDDLANSCYMLCYLFDKAYARINNQLGLDPEPTGNSPDETENDDTSTENSSSNDNSIQQQQRRLSTWAAPVFARLERRCPSFKSAELEDRLTQLAGGSLSKFFTRLAFTLSSANEKEEVTVAYPLLGPKGLLRHKPRLPKPTITDTQTTQTNLDSGFPAGDLANFMSAALRRAVAVEQLPTLETQLSSHLRERLGTVLKPMTSVLSTIAFDEAAGWLLSPTQRRDIEKVIQTGHESVAAIATLLQIRFNFGLSLPSDSLIILNSKLPVLNFQGEDTKKTENSQKVSPSDDRVFKNTYREEFEEEERDWQNKIERQQQVAAYSSTTVSLVEPLTAQSLASADRALLALPVEYRTELVLLLQPLFEEKSEEKSSLLSPQLQATAVLARGFRKLASKELRALNAGEDFRETAFAVTATAVLSQSLALPQTGYNSLQDLYEPSIALAVLSEAMGTASVDRGMLQALRRAVQIATFYHLNTPLNKRLSATNFQHRIEEILLILELGFESSSVERIDNSIRKGLEAAISDLLNIAVENENSGTLQSLLAEKEQIWLCNAFKLSKNELEQEILRPLGMSRFDSSVAALLLNSETLLNVPDIEDKFYDNLLNLGKESLLDSEILIAQRVLYLLGTILATLLADAADFTRRLAPTKADFTLKKAAMMFRHPVIKRVKSVLDAKSVAMEREKQVIEEEMKNAMLEFGMLNDDLNEENTMLQGRNEEFDDDNDDDDDDQPMTKNRLQIAAKQPPKPTPIKNSKSNAESNENRLFETAVKVCVLSLGGPELLPDALRTIEAAKTRFGNPARSSANTATPAAAIGWSSSGGSNNGVTVEQVTAEFLGDLQRALAKEYASSTATSRLGGLGQQRRRNNDEE